MKDQKSKNLLLVSVGSIFFWLSISIISNFLERLVRDILLLINVDSLIVFLISKIIFILFTVFSINYLMKLILNENLSEIFFFKVSVYTLIFGQLNSIFNPFLYKLYPININEMNVLWEAQTAYLSNSFFITFINFATEIFVHIYFAIVFYKNNFKL